MSAPYEHDETNHGELAGILITGDMLGRLQPDDVSWLGYLLTRDLGLPEDRVSVVPLWKPDPLEATRRVEEVPVFANPASRADFIDFAATRGHTEQRAHRAWNSIQFARSAAGPEIDLSWEQVDKQPRERHWAVRVTSTPEPYPSIRTSHIPGTRTEVVDLQSVYDRLRATELRTDAWVRTTVPTIRFLASLVNERLAPAEPLVPEDACETRPVGSRTSPAAAALRAWRPT